jgi:hypothetical protein
VHLTNMLEKAYAKACSVYDFEKVATQLGMLMTIDGSGDDLIKIQGLGHVSFGDEDGGDPPEDSDDDDDESGDEEPALPTSGSGGGGAAEDDDDNDDELILNDTESDEEDDTAEVDASAVACIKRFEPPEGFAIDTTLLASENDVIGRKVAMKWDGAPLEAKDFGWHIGTVKRRLTASDMEKNPDCQFWVQYSNKETNGVLPAAVGVKGKAAKRDIAHGLDPAGRTVTGVVSENDVDMRWVLLKEAAQDLAVL